MFIWQEGTDARLLEQLGMRALYIIYCNATNKSEPPTLDPKNRPKDINKISDFQGIVDALVKWSKYD